MKTTYYLISLKHTAKNDDFITFWRPNDRGYTYYQEAAGKYTEIEEGYHQSENTIPIEVSKIEHLFVDSPSNYDKGRVLPNTKENRKVLGISLKRLK